MDSAPPPSSPDVERSPPVLVSMVPSSDTEENNVGREFANRRNFNRAYVHNRRELIVHGDCTEHLSVHCFGFAFLIWLFGSMLMTGIIYRPQTVSLGPNSSLLYESNSIFVKSLKVKELDYSISGLQLFGFYRSPPLDVFMNWSESRLLSVSHQSHKAWPYYLNKGTSLNISYTVKPQGYAVQLAVQGEQGSMIPYAPWSWNLIQGSGMIEVEISKASTYYVSLTNLKRKDVEVELDIDVRAVVYDTKQSVYNCTFGISGCTFNANSFARNYVVVTSPAPSQDQRVSIDDEWYIEITYQPRYMAYVIGGGMLLCFTLVAINLCNRIQCCDGERRRTENNSARTRLLANKDEDGSSMGSSNESFAKDDADLEESTGDVGETSNSSSHSCAICYAAPRGCFFLPCGHCVSCYQCGTTIAETNGSCSICRRKIKKVKRIFTV